MAAALLYSHVYCWYATVLKEYDNEIKATDYKLVSLDKVFITGNLKYSPDMKPRLSEKTFYLDLHVCTV